MRIFSEAARRDSIADSHEKAKPLVKRWLGLGVKTDYKPALDWGVMRWVDGKEPYRRTMGWLTLTELGEKVYRQLLPELKVAEASTKGVLAYSLTSVKLK